MKKEVINEKTIESLKEIDEEKLEELVQKNWMSIAFLTAQHHALAMELKRRDIVVSSSFIEATMNMTRDIIANDVDLFNLKK